MDNLTKVYMLEAYLVTGFGEYDQFMGIFSTEQKAHEIEIRYPDIKCTITPILVDEFDPTH